MTHYQDYQSQDTHTHYTHQLSHDQYPPIQHPSINRSTTMMSSTSTFVKHSSNGEDRDAEHGSKEHALSWEQTQSPISQEPPVTEKKWWQCLFPKSLALRLFLATVILETILDLAIQGDIFSRLTSKIIPGVGIEGEQSVTRVAVFLVIFALAHVFQLVLAIDAIASQNTLQFLFLTAFNFLFLVYSLIQASEIREVSETQVLGAGVTAIPIKVLTILSHVIISVAEIAFIALGWQIWREFGWKVYKFLGADIAVKRMFQHYQIFLCLIKFDLFFFVAFSVQLIFLVLRRDDWEYYLTIAALPLSLLLLVEAYLAARHENKWLMGSFMLGCVVACVYFAYKLFRIWENQDQLRLVVKSLTVFAALSLFSLLVTCIWAVIVLKNFDKGLKKHLSKQPTIGLRRRKTTVDFGNRKGSSSFPMSTNPNRMSIE